MNTSHELTSLETSSTRRRLAVCLGSLCLVSLGTLWLQASCAPQAASQHKEYSALPTLSIADVENDAAFWGEEPPQEFCAEFLDREKLDQFLWAVSDSSCVATCGVMLESQAAFQWLESNLEKHGWQRIPSNSDMIRSYIKQEGIYRICSIQCADYKEFVQLYIQASV